MRFYHLNCRIKSFLLGTLLNLGKLSVTVVGKWVILPNFVIKRNVFCVELKGIRHFSVPMSFVSCVISVDIRLETAKLRKTLPSVQSAPK